LAERIKTLREARGWTQEQFAERSAMQRSYLADLELGRRIRRFRREISPTVPADDRLAFDDLGAKGALPAVA